MDLLPYHLLALDEFLGGDWDALDAAMAAEARYEAVTEGLSDARLFPGDERRVGLMKKAMVLFRSLPALARAEWEAQL